MWGQGFGPAAELSLGVLRAKQSDLLNCVFRERFRVLVRTIAIRASSFPAQANLIRWREEAAATRSLLNTAKPLGENRLTLRLKELDTRENTAGKSGVFPRQSGMRRRGPYANIRIWPTGRTTAFAWSTRASWT